MRVLVAHNAVPGEGSPDEADVLTQSRAVTGALSALGHEAKTLECTLDLESALARVREWAPDVVFNLVESLAGTGRLIHLFPGVLDAAGIPYAGSCAESLLATSHKAMAKRLMEAGGLPTPAWAGPRPDAAFRAPAVPDGQAAKNLWIVKSVWEHASIGLGPESLVRPRDAEELYARMDEAAPGLGGSCFAERFIPGREFNLSVLSGPEGPEVLPPAEILFEGYGEDRARIVDYRAKWDEGS
ncbi:MAG: D-alanine--D-alanine ligase, partial [Pseudomonadota bacterium]